tara:strand:- start:2646 stop:4850 length:2205 start_codon:yes stop_codon:yes gene_type:complete
MIRNFIITIILILIFFLIFIGFFSYFGIATTKFNTIIKDQIKKQNSELDIELKKVKLLLDIKNFSIKIKTIDPIIIIKNSDSLKVKEISSNILISSYFKNKFVLKNILIKSKNNEISNYINFYRLYNNSLHLILINQQVSSGKAQININLNFDETGKIKNDYNLSGKIFNTKLSLPTNKKISQLNLNFLIKDSNYKFDKIEFHFNKVKFKSKLVNIEKKNNKFFVKGNLTNKNSVINEDLILLFFQDNLDMFDFSKSKFDTESDFTFNLNKKFKIKNLKVNSKLNLDQFILKDDFSKTKNYIKNYKNSTIFKKNIINIKYFENKILANGSSEFYIDENKKNLVNFKINNSKNRTDFETFLNLKNLDIIINDISYKKINNQNATLNIKGSVDKKKLFLKNILYKENNNSIEISNLKITHGKLINVDKISLNYLTFNNFKNQLNISKIGKNYELFGSSFDSIALIENISNSDEEKNFFRIFKNLNSIINISINEVKLDNKNVINNLNGKLEIKESKIFNLNLNSSFNDIEKLFISIKTEKNKDVVTTFYSDRAKPFVKKYKFIKGFEEGNIDFSSIKKNNVTNSKLIIDNFKVQEIPVLAKILTLASLQGIADLLTGEGVRFTDFEMIYSKKNGLVTIDEIYAIGPAISIMMEGYVESKNLVSLRGTLVPATTINRTISSIPLLGDFLVGKKIGEGVFGVSFKIKGPPNELKTKVNPIKTLTPRFITRTLEKIKKN